MAGALLEVSVVALEQSRIVPAAGNGVSTEILISSKSVKTQVFERAGD